MSRQLLLIEPDRVLGAIYAGALERAGFEVIAAQNAEQAIYAADSVTPDSIVMEWEMPGHNGSAFLYEMRSHADWADIPVIVHTGLQAESLAKFEGALAQLGVVEVLYKSTHRLQTLINRVNEHLPVAV